MAFEIIKTIGRAPRAVLKLTTYKSGAPTFNIGISTVLAHACGLADNARCDILLGSGGDAGLLHLVAAAGGAFTVSKTGRHARSVIWHDCERFGSAPQRALVAARMLPGGGLALTLPDWGDGGEAGDADVVAPPPRPSPASAGEGEAKTSPAAKRGGSKQALERGKQAAAVVSPAKPAAPAIAPRAAVADVVERDGVRVILDADNESVEYAGKVMDLFDRQAQLVALLVAAMPQVVGERFLADKLFPGETHALKRLAELAETSAAAIKGVTLNLKPVKGVGYALKRVGA